MMYADTTIKLKNLIDNPATNEKLKQAMSTYPLYAKKSKEEYIPSYIPTRDELNLKIINAYKYREIGFETIGRFFDELEISLNEIMPYYNQLFFSADQDYNLLMNVDYTRTIDTEKEGTSSNTASGSTSGTNKVTEQSGGTFTESGTNVSSATTNGTKKQVSSQTPQNQIGITAQNIDSINYADDVKWDKDNGSTNTNETTESSQTSSNNSTQSGTTSGEASSTSSGETSDSESRVETTRGNFGVMASQDFVLKYRQTILNIEQLIINDKRIKELFMLIW